MTDYDFDVVVKDQNGVAVSGATVTMYDILGNTVFTATTNSSGIFDSPKLVSDLNNPKELEVSKTGYEDVLLYLNITQDELSYYVRLNAYSTNYTTIEKVREYMQLNSQAFIAGKTVSDDIIADRINEAEAIIDDYCRRAWRSTTKTEYFTVTYRDKNSELFVPLYLTHSHIYDLSSAAGDELENWTGSAWSDFIADKTEGRANDYWVDTERGIVYIKPTNYGERVIKVSYRYGNESVPNDIRKACIMLVCSDILMFDNNSNTIPDGYSSSISYSDKSTRLRNSAYDILDRYKNIYHARLL